MNQDDFSRVASAALQQIESLLAEWLPNGVRDGAEYCIGSRHGEAGDSMRIRLTGDRAGKWSDFADDSAAGGDLISLYAYLQGISQGKACAALARLLNVPLSGDDDRRGRSSSARPKPAPAPAVQGEQAAAEKKPRSEWEPILPVPDLAGPYPVAHTVRGKPAKVWEYRDQEGRLLGIVCRFVKSDGGKEIIPCVYARHAQTGACKWHWISFRDPRPLYLLCELREDVPLPVLVVEGEKCADAAYSMLGIQFDVVSWPGGGKAVDKADWSLIAGRHVVLWPDADAKKFKEGHAQAGQIMPEEKQPGMSTMLKLEKILLDLGCTVEFVDIPPPGEKPDGWDVADLVDEGAMPEEVLAWANKRRTIAAADDQQAAPPADEIPPWVTDADDASPPSAAGAAPLDWKELYALLIKTDKGLVKGCRENVYFCLQHDAALIGLVALDEFSMLQVKRRQPPWPSDKGEWTESDDFRLGLYLSKKYYLTVANIGDIERAVAQAARENVFNPVIEQFDGCALKWDGKPRVADAFSIYWGAPPSEYMRKISCMFFVGLAKRAYVPGVKHDYAPVFEGGQGRGKSTALAILGGEWFADTPFQMGHKDGYLSIQGVLIYEIAELEQFNRSEVTAVKAFMSSQKDRYREPYGRRMKNQLRRTVFAATTNEGQYFKDTTGNRRFWPVDTGQLDLDGLRRDREQLLGEAVHLMREGMKWHPTPEEQLRLITPQQESREIPDEWAGRIWEYLEGIGMDGQPLGAGRINRVTARELIIRALHIEIGKVSQAKTETRRISDIMRKLGWSKKRETCGAREWYYERPKEEPVPEAAAEEEDEPLPI